MNDISRLDRALSRCFQAREAATPLVGDFVHRRMAWILKQWGSRAFDSEQREELAQTVLVEVLESFDFYARPDRGWRRVLNLMRETVKRAVAQRGERLARSSEADVDRVTPSGLNALPDLDAARARDALDGLDIALVSRLGGAQAVTLLLVAAGVKQKEIAAARGVSKTKVSRDLRDAREAYRALGGRVDA